MFIMSIYHCIIRFFQDGNDKYDKFCKGFHEKYLISSDKLARNICNEHEKDLIIQTSNKLLQIKKKTNNHQKNGQSL